MGQTIDKRIVRVGVYAEEVQEEVDIEDFGLKQDDRLTAVVEHLYEEQTRHSPEITDTEVQAVEFEDGELSGEAEKALKDVLDDQLGPRDNRVAEELEEDWVNEQASRAEAMEAKREDREYGL